LLLSTGLLFFLRMDSSCTVNSFGHATALFTLITVGRVTIGHRFLLLANVMIAADTTFVAVVNLLCFCVTEMCFVILQMYLQMWS